VINAQHVKIIPVLCVGYCSMKAGLLVLTPHTVTPTLATFSWFVMNKDHSCPTPDDTSYQEDCNFLDDTKSLTVKHDFINELNSLKIE